LTFCSTDANALEAHAVSTVLGGKSLSFPCSSRVVLDEDEVPELDVARAADVDGADVPASARPVAGSVRESMWISEHGPHGPSRPSPRISRVEAQHCARGQVGDLAP
jgi:hypothetical protein